MIFYRSPKPIKAISFDLDDTLYNNYPTIMAAEQALIIHLQSVHPNLKNITKRDIELVREQVLLEQPKLSSDVTLLRRHWLAKLFNNHKIPNSDNHIGPTFSTFMLARNRISISQKTITFLSKLKSRVPLIAISNGNLDIETTPLANYFTLKMFANSDNKAKPDPAMFLLASQKLSIPCEHILHIGDQLNTDVLGAKRAGCQAAWFDPYSAVKPYPVLADLQLQSLDELLNLV
ncbi:2-haloalkanoic acid dehalogenase [Saccharobesus litoralis]|uniref:2-haloalkanoic acid dehalogenase n=1 Tax=Saccharobesus litoralis TaxID=2172099 RepID=A0A2S0VQ76_9ALTE|nr:HAD-IA family hydrolase [Saccharobesus litoralis]AWB66368.1 2-haloalkanoic acid dehalogenase [Saccharobesus litoralis]